MNKLFIIAFTFLLTFSLVFAQVEENDTNLEDLEKIDQITNQILDCDYLNSNLEKIIGFQLPEKIPYKNEIINIYLNNLSLGGIVLENSTVTSFSCKKPLEEYTYNLYIKNSSIFLDFEKEFTSEKIVEKLNDGSIKVEGRTSGKKIKWFFSKLAIKWFF